MKYCLYDVFDDYERRKLESQHLHVYDLRLNDDGDEIATIEPHVWVNNCGTIVTEEEIKFPNEQDKFVDFEEFCSNNDEVEELWEVNYEEV